MNICKQKVMTLIAILLLTACQTTTPTAPVKESYYGDYYLWLKTLSNSELIEEINQQKQKAFATLNTPSYEQTEVKLLLLHSLPNSPIHNPYTAKSTLNQYQLAQQETNNFSNENLALIQLLRDQLNEQLLLFHQMMLKEKTLDQQQVIISTKNKEIIALQNKSAHLEEKIIQLKAIEKNIDEHGNNQ